MRTGGASTLASGARDEKFVTVYAADADRQSANTIPDGESFPIQLIPPTAGDAGAPGAGNTPGGGQTPGGNGASSMAVPVALAAVLALAAL